jgi:TRAP-type C4-dicarboxylate transport system substrate-binding protein
MAGPVPPYEVMGRGKPPLQLSDWKGLWVRAPGGMGEALKPLGVVPTSMDPTETYTAIERGTVDGIGLPSTTSFAAFRIYEVSKWLTVNMTLAVGSAPLMVNTEALNQLPPQYRTLLNEARTAAYADFQKGYAEVDQKNFPLFKQKGIQFIKYTDQQLAELHRRAAEPVWEAWVKEVSAAGLPGREILDVVLKAAKD